MKNVLITGATGMIGGLVLQECLQSTNISKVTSFVRKESGIKNNKLTEVVVNDFTNYSVYEEYFKSIDIVYFCVGVYTGAVSRDEFRKITVDYTKAFADKLKELSPNAAFCFLSGAGADQKEKSRMMFAKDKGIAENYLLKKHLKQLTIFRPAYIYPVKKRKEPNFTYRLTRRLYPILKIIVPNGVITSVQLAHAMFISGLKGSNKTILENKEIKQIV